MAIGWEEFWEYVEGAPHVLEKIVEHSIFDGRVMCSRGEICEMRLRNKAWNAAVLKVLKDRHVPLFLVRMTGKNSLNDSPEVQEHGKKLDNFVEFMESLPDITELHTFKLTVERAAVSEESLDSISKLFSSFGKHLLKLKFLNLPENGGMMPGLFPNLQLPALYSLKLTVVGDDYEHEDDEQSELTRLFRPLLQGAVALKKLKVRGVERVPDFHGLPLPPKLKLLRLDGVGEETLDLIQRSDLPDLTDLQLHLVESQKPTAQLLFPVMEKFGKVLRRLSVHPCEIGATDRVRVLQWELPPLMEVLTFFECSFPLYGPSLGLAERLPKITTLRIVAQHPEQLSLWINPSSVPMVGVKDLTLGLCREPSTPESPSFLPLTLELARGAAHTFPNLTRFHFSARATDVPVFNYIFGHFQLKELVINGLPKREDDGDEVDEEEEQVWNPLLLGFTIIKDKDFGLYYGPNATHHRITKMRGLEDIRLNWLGVVRGSRISFGVVWRLQMVLPKLKMFMEMGPLPGRKESCITATRRGIGRQQFTLKRQDWKAEEDRLLMQEMEEEDAMEQDEGTDSEEEKEEEGMDAGEEDEENAEH